MKLTILGSGSLFPYPNRGNSGYLLECSEATILLDGGSGTLRRIADFGLDYSSIDIICYTHLHIDHTFDLIPFLFALKHDSKVKKPKRVKIIAPISFIQFFNKLYKIYYKWIHTKDIIIDINELKPNDSINMNDIKVTAGNTKHTDNSLSYKINNSSSSFFYTGDTDFTNDLVLTGKNSDMVLMECSFPDNNKVDNHLTPIECGKLAQMINCKKLILTHFFPINENNDDLILRSVRKYYNGEIILANDGNTYIP
tara:strand:+ start:3802 stop:4563 length:762 start_codon:yes stop_codon:yes gene_type:complete